jgi:hypothetical protein
MPTTHSLLPAPRAKRQRARRCIVALASCLALSPTMADERAELDQLRATTLALIQALVDQGLISGERAQALTRQAGTRTPAAPAAAAAAPAAPTAAANEWGRPPSNGTVRVPYLSETTKAQIKEEVKNDVLTTAREEGWADARQLPSWLKTFDFEGDLRVRYDYAFLSSSNTPAELYRSQVDSPAWSPDLTNTQTDRSRLTVRARFGFTANLSDEFAAAMRVSTGTNPTSKSQTLGASPGFFNGYTIFLDRAWLRWQPSNDLQLWAGRMPSPFRLPASYLSSDLLWPDDISLDGVALTYQHTLGSGIYGFANVGAFVLQELDTSTNDKWLYAGQVGIDMWPTEQTQLRLSAALYDFQNIAGVRETEPPPTGPAIGTTGYYSTEYRFGVRQKGNTLIRLNDPTNNGAPVWGLASQFQPVVLTAALRLNQIENLQVGITGDYVKNTAFDLADIQSRGKAPALADLSSKTTGGQLRFQIGSKQTDITGAWDAYFSLRYFERDSWVDAFTDTTWNGGGTNYRGYSIGGAYTVGRRTTLGLRYTSTSNLDDGQRFLSNPADPTSSTGNLSSAPLKVDILQVELNAKF